MIKATQNDQPYVILNSHQRKNEKTIVVVGCSRGGTSMVAGVLRELSIFMGDRMTGTNHEDVEFTTTNVGTLRAIIAKRNATHKIWGWKYPHVNEYISDILGDLKNPYFIFIFRNIIDVAKSYTKYHNKDIRLTLQDSYSRYASIVELAKNCTHPAMLVSFDKALDFRHQFVDGLIDFLGLMVSGEERANAIEFINCAGGYKKTSFDTNKIFLSIQTIESYSDIKIDNEFLSFKTSLHNARNENEKFLGINNDPQFIFTPDEQNTFPQNLLFSFYFSTEASSFESRIYIDFGSGFYAMASQEIPVKNGHNMFQIQFETDFYRLRFDPLNTNAPFSISNIEIIKVLSQRCCFAKPDTRQLPRAYELTRGFHPQPLVRVPLVVVFELFC